jgi:hypothetical protein
MRMGYTNISLKIFFSFNQVLTISDNLCAELGFHNVFCFLCSTKMFSFALVNGSCLVQLTLKRNIPNNMFLHEIGRHCPSLQVLYTILLYLL